MISLTSRPSCRWRFAGSIRPRPAPRRAARPSHRRCRGSVYLAVLGAAMLVALIGVTGVMVNRVQYRTADANEAMARARLLARSAAELAMQRIGETPGWRSAFAHDTWTGKLALGDGVISFKLVDEVDGDLADAADDPIRVVGRGEVGDAMRMCSVQLTMDPAAEGGFRIVTGSWRQVVEQP